MDTSEDADTIDVPPSRGEEAERRRLTSRAGSLYAGGYSTEQIAAILREDERIVRQALVADGVEMH